MKTCTGCHQEKPLDAFHNSKAHKGGKLPRCKECIKTYMQKRHADNSERLNAVSREYRKKPGRRAAHRDYCRNWTRARMDEIMTKQKKWRQENPDQYKARGAVSSALQHGKIIKPTSCSACGEASDRIEAHHRKGYAAEFRLDVVWLCKPCHYKADKTS